MVGAAVRPDLVAGDARYAATLAAEFNSITPENAFKWPATEPEAAGYTWAEADAVAAAAEQNDQGIRGHTLVWPNTFSATRFEILPDYVTDGDADAMQRALDDHITAVVTRYADVTDRWDVVNEVMSFDGSGVDPNPLTQTLGEAWIVRAFELTHQLDPDAELYINENGIEQPGPKHDQLVALVGRLLEAGAPIHGVGLQGHFIVELPDREALTAVMADWESLGLAVALTEVDIATDDSEAHTQGYADLFGACLESPACGEVTMWGVTDAHTWITDFFGQSFAPLLFDAEYQPKPAYDAIVAELAGP